MTKITREILELAKSDLGGYSDKQFALVGISRPIPKGWRKKVVGQEFPDASVTEFIALKNAHLTPARRQYALNRKEVMKKRRAAEADALAAVGLPQIGER